MGHLNKFDVYKLCIEEAGKISERRMKNNQFFILFHSALISFIVTLYVRNGNIKENLAIIFLSVIGVVLGFFWHNSILSYKRLNSAKFKVICSMEDDSEFCHCLTDEWKFLKDESDHKEISRHECDIAILFIFAYIISIIYHLICIGD